MTLAGTEAIKTDAVLPAAIGRAWTPGVMSSVRQDWATPRVLFEMLNKEFHFALDVCATTETATCKEFFYEHGLDHPWIGSSDGAIWCNPPYGRGIGDWVEKGIRSARLLHVTVVMLLPARTDTLWFHHYCLKGEIRFLRGRLYFDDGKRARAPFPSMIVVFRPEAR